MHILDTDTLTHLQKGNEKVKLRLLQANDFEFAITIITKAEILRGRIEFLLKADNAEPWFGRKDFCSKVKIFWNKFRL
jgi:tRNA(fMet)-specific endonuclease VapC